MNLNENKNKRSLFKVLGVARNEFFIVIGLSLISFVVANYYHVFGKLYRFSRQHEYLELEGIFTASLIAVVGLFYFSMRRWYEARQRQRQLSRKNAELEKALAEIKRLQGIIPICSSCKKIRDDDGFWHQVEAYIQSHAGVAFSHGVCPECMEKLYPTIAKKKEIKNG